jgi:hypothetical protein
MSSTRQKLVLDHKREREWETEPSNQEMGQEYRTMLAYKDFGSKNIGAAYQ